MGDAGGHGERGRRIAALDVLRGLVMVLMALDHVRDYLGGFGSDPTDLSTTTPGLFLTRWVTHFCAPVFVLLAGTSAFLYGARRTRGELSLFLATRGLWLIVLEFTAVHLGWFLSYSGFLVFQVIGAIGVSMLALSLLVFLPLSALAAIGLAIVGGHDLLDGVHPSGGGWPWTLLHEQGAVRVGGQVLIVTYPVLAWIGVMACGYALGPLVRMEPERRRRALALLGLALVLLFVVLRGTNAYGDPVPWRRQETPLFTLLSFLNCTKYPPSLLFLAMTLGPALLFLAALDRPQLVRRAPGRWLAVFGRVPLFFYVVHVYVVHVGAALYYRVVTGDFRFLAPGNPSPWEGLGAVYAFWAAVVLALYLPCRWYAGVKRRSGSPLLSYL